MIISSSSSPEAERRERTRDLADISINAFNDAKLDVKIEAADQIALSLFGGLPSDDQRLANLITVSNLQAAILIRIGIGGDENTEIIRELRKTCKDIVDAANNRTMQQFKPTVRMTPGMTSGASGFGQ